MAACSEKSVEPALTADFDPLIDACISTTFEAQDGNRLGVVGSFQSWDVTKALPLVKQEDSLFSQAHLMLPSGSSFEFKLVLLSPEGVVVWEPGSNHRIDLPSTSRPLAKVNVDCSWGRAENTTFEDEDNQVECQIIVPLVAAASSQHLVLVGSTRSLGRWRVDSGLRLSRSGNAWMGQVSLPASHAVEAKLVLVDEAGAHTSQWEMGNGNRFIQPLSPSLLVLHWGITSYARILPVDSSQQVDIRLAPSSDDIEVLSDPQPSLLEFEIPSYVTRPGQSLKVVGSAPELGSWDPSKALPLQWKPGHAWSASLPLMLNGGAVEAKVIFQENGDYTWEPGSNRKLDLSSLLSSSLWSRGINASSYGHLTLYWGHTDSTPLIVVPTCTAQLTDPAPSHPSEAVIDLDQKDVIQEKGEESIVRLLTMVVSGLMISPESPPPPQPKEDQSQLVGAFKFELESLKKKLATTTEELHSARKLALDQWGLGETKVEQVSMQEKEKERAQKLLDENNKLKDRIAEIQGAMAQLESSNKAVKIDSRNTAMEMQKKLAMVEKETKEVERSLVAQSNAKIASMKMTIVELERAQASYAMASKESAKTEKDLRSQLSDALAKRDVALSELKRSRQDAADSTHSLQSKLDAFEKKAMADVEAWGKKVSSLEVELTAKGQEVVTLTAQSDAYTSFIDKIKMELSEAVAAASELTFKMADLQARLASNTAAIAGLEAEKKRLEAAIAQLKRQEALAPSASSTEGVVVKGGEVADLRSQLLRMQNQVAEVKAEETKRRVEEAAKLRKEFESRLASQRNLLLAAKASDVANLTKKHEAEGALLMSQIQQLQDQIELLRSNTPLNNIVPFISDKEPKKANKVWGGWWFGNTGQSSVAAAAKEDNETVAPAPTATRRQPQPPVPKAEDVVSSPSKPDAPKRQLKPLEDYLDIVD
jgi:hypothetical protein